MLDFQSVEAFDSFSSSARFDIKHSLQTKRTGFEMLIALNGPQLPDAIRSQQVDHKGFGAVA